MLVLTRKPNESIVIGGNVRITVASIRGRTVRIGIEAPGDVGIFREEICPAAALSPAQPLAASGGGGGPIKSTDQSSAPGHTGETSR